MVPTHAGVVILSCILRICVCIIFNSLPLFYSIIYEICYSGTMRIIYANFSMTSMSTMTVMVAKMMNIDLVHVCWFAVKKGMNGRQPFKSPVRGRVREDT